MSLESPVQAGVAERAALEARLAALNDEIRAYPQPIAHCDAQLAGLLEERDRLRAQLAPAAARR